MVTPSAPRAKAAAMPRPSTMPPAATIGTSTFSRTACSRAKVWTSSGLRRPALSAPSTISPSTPASTALMAPRRVAVA
jgi:hypothetical protein